MVGDLNSCLVPLNVALIKCNNALYNICVLETFKKALGMQAAWRTSQISPAIIFINGLSSTHQTHYHLRMATNGWDTAL